MREGSCQPAVGTHPLLALLESKTWNYLVVKFLDVREARRFHRLALQALTHNCKRPPQPLPALSEEPAPLPERRSLRQLGMVALDYARGLDGLDPASGATCRVSLGEERVPVRDAADEPAEVDVVEGRGGEGPGQGAVLDLAWARVSALLWSLAGERRRTWEARGSQFQIWRHHGRLLWRYVGADDFRLGKGVRKVAIPQSINAN